MVNEIQPMSAVPTTYVQRQVTYKVWDGQLATGSEKVEATTTEVTVYDRNGHVMTTTNVHTNEYTV